MTYSPSDGKSDYIIGAQIASRGPTTQGRNAEVGNTGFDHCGIWMGYSDLARTRVSDLQLASQFMSKPQQ